MGELLLLAKHEGACSPVRRLSRHKFVVTDQGKPSAGWAWPGGRRDLPAGGFVAGGACADKPDAPPPPRVRWSRLAGRPVDPAPILSRLAPRPVDPVPELVATRAARRGPGG